MFVCLSQTSFLLLTLLAYFLFSKLLLNLFPFFFSPIDPKPTVFICLSQTSFHLLTLHACVLFSKLLLNLFLFFFLFFHSYCTDNVHPSYASIHLLTLSPGYSQFSKLQSEDGTRGNVLSPESRSKFGWWFGVTPGAGTVPLGRSSGYDPLNRSLYN